MTPEERRTVVVTAAVLLLASLVRVGWEARSRPPLLPADTSAYAGLLEKTDRLIADEDRRNTPLAEGERIDPNRASEVELSRLPGVGPALAGRIVASREGEGPFQRPEDLARVPGIGEATVARLRDLVDLADPPTPGAEGVGGGALAGGEIEGGRLDLNRAGAAELEELPGIGPALSARILEERRARGGFRHVEELLDVQGIGPVVLDRLRPHLEVW